MVRDILNFSQDKHLMRISRLKHSAGDGNVALATMVNSTERMVYQVKLDGILFVPLYDRVPRTNTCSFLTDITHYDDSLDRVYICREK